MQAHNKSWLRVQSLWYFEVPCPGQKGAGFRRAVHAAIDKCTAEESTEGTCNTEPSGAIAALVKYQ